MGKDRTGKQPLSSQQRIDQFCPPGSGDPVSGSPVAEGAKDELAELKTKVAQLMTRMGELHHLAEDAENRSRCVVGFPEGVEASQVVASGLRGRHAACILASSLHTQHPLMQVLSWNVNGLLDKIKRSTVFNALRRYTTSMVLLQKTHLLGTHCSMLARGGHDRVYQADFSKGSRGVAALLHRSLPIVITGTQLDPQGRYAVVSGMLGGSRLIS
ncbi:hypothetical protein NDU88_010359 [Pleurodeles waltl]|uniref:Uncharacterized protein n=1 Tax=Pleurodeles waltl TaxID=8319 RepID=A0AAV7PVR5_PLEWA|nr:hypothetical protein NDU88_010359 [Pleurodeles waltl]